MMSGPPDPSGPSEDLESSHYVKEHQVKVEWDGSMANEQNKTMSMGPSQLHTPESKSSTPATGIT